METSILIAKIIGVIYLSFGIGFVLNKEYYSQVFKELLTDNSYLILGGIMAIVFGILILTNHNIYETNWRVIITIIGWAATIKGSFLLISPKSILWFKPMFKSKIFLTALGPIIVLFGLLFCYFGFF